MTAAVILLWAGCLWSIARGVCCLLWTASPLRQLLVLTVLVLARLSCHSPQKNASPPA